MSSNLPYSAVPSFFPRVQGLCQQHVRRIDLCGPSAYHWCASPRTCGSLHQKERWLYKASWASKETLMILQAEWRPTKLGLSQLRSPNQRTANTSICTQARPLSRQLAADNADQNAGQRMARRTMNFAPSMKWMYEQMAVTSIVFEVEKAALTDMPFRSYVAGPRPAAPEILPFAAL